MNMQMLNAEAQRPAVAGAAKFCPFCGASGEAIEHMPYDRGVLCHGCGCWMPSRVSTEPGRSHGALEMWNRRANAVGRCEG